MSAFDSHENPANMLAGSVSISRSRSLGQSLLLSAFFVLAALMVAHPNEALNAELFKSMLIVLMVSFLALLSRIWDDHDYESFLGLNQQRLKEIVLSVCLASCFSAVVLDVLVWEEAKPLVETSTAASASISSVIALAIVGLVVAFSCGFSMGSRLKRALLTIAMTTSVLAVFGEIALVMSVREPRLPHTAAIYERFATFYLVLATALFVSYRVYHFAKEPVELED